MQESDAKYRAILGHERRWGQSTMPLDVKVVDGLMRVKDVENGAETYWDYSWWRIRRVKEKEPTK